MNTEKDQSSGTYSSGEWLSWENLRDNRTIRFHHRDGSHVDYDTVTDRVVD